MNLTVLQLLVLKKMKLLKAKVFLLLLLVGFGYASSHMETLLPPIRRPRHRRVGFHISQQCSANITAPAQDATSADVPITAKVVCNNKVLFEKTQPLSKLKETMLAQGIWLFKKSRTGESGYLVFENGLSFQLANSVFKNLPPLPGGKTAAPLIVDGSMVWIYDSIFEGNKGFDIAGAVYATSTPTTRTKVRFFDSTISDNSADRAGALVADQHAEINGNNCQFLRNFGKQAGAIILRDFAGVDLEDCTLEGVGVSDNFTRWSSIEAIVHLSRLFHQVNFSLSVFS